MSTAARQTLVSVLTPSMNQGQWLGENLTSVASQTHPAIEHIVMDGGSDDESLTLLAAASRNVAWRSEPDAGQTDALIKAFEASRGAVIGWLNSDDAYYSRTSVAAAVQAFADRPEVDVLYGHSAVVDADGRLLHFNWVPGYHGSVLKIHNYIVQPAVFIRRSALEKHGFVDPTYQYAMDRELWLRLARHCRFERIDRVVAIDRHQEARKSYTRLDLYEPDKERLEAEHGIARPGVRLKALKVSFRLAGMSLAARRNAPEEHAFRLSVPPRRRLAVQQTLLPRHRI
jgi:glycosyltransferase involved in cell wall biosynthesis